MCSYRVIERVVREKVVGYQVEYEAWTTDYNAVMLYYDFRDWLESGIKLYRNICLLDENWRIAVLTKKIEHDTDFAGDLRELFVKMARLLCRTRDTLLAHYEDEYGDVEHAEDFRRCCNELTDMLTPDADFFNHDALVDLRDAALDEVG